MESLHGLPDRPPSPAPTRTDPIVADEYRIPKREISAQVTLPGIGMLTLTLFLADRAQSHAGDELPSDLVNGKEDFFPARHPEGRVGFLHRDTLISMTVAAEEEFGHDIVRAEDLAPNEAQSSRVEVLLEDGSHLRGTIVYLLPAGQCRLQDTLNVDSRFLLLRDGEHAHLVNKRRVVRVLPIV